MNKSLLNLPPLDAIRGFVAVARRMSITLAANDLCLTQSAVSRQIQGLEEHLGTPLLIRKHRAIALTDAGEQLLQLASPWLDRLIEYSESLRKSAQLHSVTITASISVTGLWILPRLGTFQEAHPHIDVRVSANNRVLDLKKEDIDLAIRYARAQDVPANAIRLFTEKIIPVANKKVAARAFKNPKALLNEVLLELDERALPWLRWSDWLTATGLPHAKPKAYLHLNQYDQVIHAAIEGHGVALGRVALVQPMLKDGRLVALGDSSLGNSDYAYWLMEGSSSPRAEVQVFRNWIIAEAGLNEHQLEPGNLT
ncbi:LysR substrate-binding domain-containing protein [Undibacterium sp. TS12]|uniref:LysR substrate-binding domain-containing protein n=1 Tax=Undibacterium sp. TS12 TaxID=2908202 RepID=UPI001F4CF428|nr:LysR substrate-binding domain-containing protein [Undibacterium sp. TS12]MCH8617516.1 LysR substrate-binding domain-containing protein [Undibacterium sp. TS12]